MQDTFEFLWRRARSLENHGDLLAAKAIYEPILRAEPDRLYVRLRMSAIEEAQGNYRAAREHALLSAETVRNARWKDLAVVTKRLLTFDEHAVVRSLILGVDWEDPDILRSSVVLSQHLWLIGEVEQALRMIENALVRAPSSHLLSYSRAHVLRYMGRLDEATTEYERCLDLDPNDAIAHWSLAYHQKSRVPGARVGRIRKTQAAIPADSADQPYLHYALFKEFDDANDIDQAWAHLQAGARMRRQSIRYDTVLEEQGFVALQRLTSSGFLEPGGREASSERVPIFIVGMPRSGTTLLERILGNHSQVVAAGELNDFTSALCWESNQFMASFITPEAVARLEGIDYARVGSAYMDRTHEKALGSRFLVDKNPMNFINAGFIGKALPQAKIVCLRRGAMDACFSNLKELFSSEAYGYSYDLNELADYYIRFTRMCEHWQEVMPDQFHLLDYESLVADTAAETERVMKFCGLTFEPESIDITANTAPVSTASSSQVRQPINSKGVDAWRRYATHLEPLRSRLQQGSRPA